VKRFRSCSDVDASQVGDRLVLYHRRTRKALVLNPSGSELWTRLERARSADDLMGALVERYPSLDRETARRDAEAFLAELGAHEMLAVDEA